jgi:hypothetical protein
MSKKSTTVETGLGDDQYRVITDNQKSIGGSIDTLANDADRAFTTSSDNQDKILTNQGDLSRDFETGVGNLTKGQADILGAVKTNKVDLSPVTSGISKLQTSQNSGFDTVYGRFDDVDDSFTDMGGRFDSLDGRFDTTDQSLTDINTAVTDGFGTVDDTLVGMGEAIGTRFNTVDDNVESGFTFAEEARAAMQTLLATGQADMTTLMENYGGDQTRYYTDLMAGQGELKEGQAGIQTGLSEFEDTYSKNTDMTAKKLGEVQTQVTNGFSGVMGGQGDIAGQVAGVNQRVTEADRSINETRNIVGSQESSVDYARIARDVATGADQASEVAAQNGEMFADKLTTIRSILGDQTNQLDDRIKNQYTRLSNSFDQNGKLISRQVNDNGTTVSRAIDQQGNLLMAAFDQNGQRMQQDSLNINSLMAAFDQQMRYQGGSNYAMGAPSPANNRRSGLASPYTNTY